MGKKSQRERQEMLGQMGQTKPQPVRLDELKDRMEKRAKAAGGGAANSKRSWWRRLFGR